MLKIEISKFWYHFVVCKFTIVTPKMERFVIRIWKIHIKFAESELLVIQSKDHTHCKECISGKLPGCKLVSRSVPHTPGSDLDCLGLSGCHGNHHNYFVPGDNTTWLRSQLFCTWGQHNIVTICTTILCLGTTQHWLVFGICQNNLGLHVLGNRNIDPWRFESNGCSKYRAKNWVAQSYYALA